MTHDRLVNYMKAIASAAPDRVKLETMGFTYEGRPQVLLIITSPKNQQRLEEIRQQHVKLTDPSQSSSVNIDNMPIVVWIGHSIHGNAKGQTPRDMPPWNSRLTKMPTPEQGNRNGAPPPTWIRSHQTHGSSPKSCWHISGSLRGDA